MTLPRKTLLHMRQVAALLLMNLMACATAPSAVHGRSDPALDGLERHVREFCARKVPERIALTEDLRRKLSPSAQVVILCDH